MNTQFGYRFDPKKALIMLCGALLLSACAEKPQPVAQAPEPAPPPPKPKPTLQVTNFFPAPPEKKGVVAANIEFVNSTESTLEYVMFKTTAYTADGKLVPSKKSGRENAWLRVAGPFAPGQSSGNKRWDKVWQNSKLSCFRIEGAELIDVDGVVEYFEIDQIKLPSASTSAECGAPALAQTSAKPG